MVYSRTEANAEKFAKDYNIPNFSTNMLASIEHHDVDTVIIALSNNMHLEAFLACAKAENSSGWLFPVADEVHELGYSHMFTDMFEAIENQSQPNENFYDGYITNAIIDAAYLSIKSKQWEPIIIEQWRGQIQESKERKWQDFDEDNYLIKEEILPKGIKKSIIKNKKTGSIEKR
jgi:predicted dehydrogenase